MKLQSLKTGKEAQPEVSTEVWCIRCKDKGHDKDHCHVYQNYLFRGGHVTLKLENIVGPSTGVPLWCAIFQIDGKHATNHCHLLENFVQTPQQLFCTFCKSVGHNERNCRSYELMMEQTPTYRMQIENQPKDQGVGAVHEGFHGQGRGRGGGAGRGHG